MRTLIRWYRGHGTKALGAASTIIYGFLAIDGLIPEGHVKYWLAAGVVVGALTFGRGFTNSRNRPNA